MNRSQSITLAVIAVITIGVISYLVVSAGLFLSDDSPVAMVNGEEITRGNFNSYLLQAEAQNMSEQEVDKDLLLEDLINEKLLLQEARRIDLSATDEEMEEEMEALYAQFGGEEGLNEILATENMTRDDLMVMINNQISINKYVNSIVQERGIEVTQQEILDFYNEALAMSDDVPELGEVSEFIEQQLLNDKIDQAMFAVLEELRMNAEIEIMI